MKKNSILAILMAAITGLLSVGCDTSSDYDTEVSRDCLITAVTMGTLNVTYHTTSSTGGDSTYTGSVTGSSYPMYIDQLNNHIYNPDSLPVGTDVSKVVFSTFTVSSYASIKSLTTAEDTTFTASDSTDFTQPRTFTVFAQDVTQKREYTVEVRVHKESGDSCNWQTIANGTALGIQPMQKMRAISSGGEIYVFGQLATGESQLVKGNSANAAFDSATNVYAASGAQIDVETVCYFKGKFYALASTELFASETGEGTWQATGAEQRFSALVGTSTDSLFALSADGKVYATADGVAWNESATDNDGPLPDTNIVSTHFASRTSSNYESLLLVGEKDNAACVWRKDIDLTGDFSYSWFYLPQTEELGDYGYPLLSSPSLVCYDDACMLVGVTNEGEVSPFYFSRDNGRTWISGDLEHPDMTGVTATTCVTDDDNYLWMFNSGTGSIYKGRINRLGWTTEQTRFERSPRK